MVIFYCRRMADVGDQHSHFLEMNVGVKVLYFDTKPKVTERDIDDEITYPNLSWIKNTLNSFKLKNLQELHLNGFRIDLNEPEFKKLLETIAENMPKLKLLCITGELENGEWNGYAKICQEFASAKNIKLEI